MNKLLAAVGILSALAPSLTSAMSIDSFEAQLQIVPRYHAGTIQKDVERVQTYLESDQENPIPVWKLNLIKYETNMKAIRAHVLCVETPSQCGNAGWVPSN